MHLIFIHLKIFGLIVVLTALVFGVNWCIEMLMFDLRRFLNSAGRMREAEHPRRLSPFERPKPNRSVRNSHLFEDRGFEQHFVQRQTRDNSRD